MSYDPDSEAAVTKGNREPVALAELIRDVPTLKRLSSPASVNGSRRYRHEVAAVFGAIPVVLLLQQLALIVHDEDRDLGLVVGAAHVFMGVGRRAEERLKSVAEFPRLGQRQPKTDRMQTTRRVASQVFKSHVETVARPVA